MKGKFRIVKRMEMANWLFQTVVTLKENGKMISRMVLGSIKYQMKDVTKDHFLLESKLEKVNTFTKTAFTKEGFWMTNSTGKGY